MASRCLTLTYTPELKCLDRLNCWHLPGSRFPYSVSSQADLPDELLGDVENAHKVLGKVSRKDLEAAETDLDIAQVRAGVRADVCGL